MSPTFQEENYLPVSFSREATRPSFLCNIFSHKFDIIVDVDEHHSYVECTRCGCREGFTTFSISLKGELADLIKKS